ncbi:hypothetical protein FBULB1_12615 [Fusarium bulbicola]|nr:hypothetical protein FBULB1_12615 [Fusarium bulbicola]
MPAINTPVYSGKQDALCNLWLPYDWHDEEGGKQVRGQVTVIRACGTSGDLIAGYWRITLTSPYARPDGSYSFVYPSPTGDDITCVLEGTAIITNLSTGMKNEVGPGAIVSTPRGLRVHWEIASPGLRTFWCIWAGTTLTPNPPTELQVTHVNDDPGCWLDYNYNTLEPGARSLEEFFYISRNGSSGTFITGIRRFKEGTFDLSNGPQNNLMLRYSVEAGDETMLLLEGSVKVVDTASGALHHFSKGDIIGLSRGAQVAWMTARQPCKVLWIITSDN